MIYLLLFWEFFKTGLFAVGGGMATLPFLYSMSAAHPDWFTTAQLADMVAVSESTPGPIGVNMATYVGFTTSGLAGSIVATLGLITPSVIVILIIARILDKFRKNEYVDSAFYALRPCSIGLISAAGLLVAKIALLNTGLYAATSKLFDLINLKAIALAVVILVLTRYVKKTKKLHPIWFIVFSAVVGIVFKF